MLAVSGLTVVALAKELGISESTARSQIKRQYHKTGSKNLVELTVLAEKLSVRRM